MYIDPPSSMTRARERGLVARGGRKKVDLTDHTSQENCERPPLLISQPSCYQRGHCSNQISEPSVPRSSKVLLRGGKGNEPKAPCYRTKATHHQPSASFPSFSPCSPTPPFLRIKSSGTHNLQHRNHRPDLYRVRVLEVGFEVRASASFDR